MVDWLLDCEPRLVQIEALNRSFVGIRTRDNMHEALPEAIPLRDGAARGWAHYMEMRLGKTPTLLAEFMLFRRDYGIKRLVVIAPNRYKLDWVVEAEKFGIKIPMHSFETSQRAKYRQFAQRNPEHIVAVNIEAMQRDEVVSIMGDIWDRDTMVAIDESYSISNHKAKSTENLISLAPQAGPRRLLSGKPIAQGPHDIWAQFRFLGRLNKFKFYAFKSYFCRMGGFKRKKVIGTLNEEDFNDIMNSASFKARRSDWRINEKIEYADIRVELPKEQMQAFKTMETESVLEVGGQEIPALQVITRLLKLQQISSGFIYNEDKNPVSLVGINKDKKLEALKEKIDGIPGKIIVICVFKPTIDRLTEALKDYGVAVIRGGMSPEDTIAAKNKFNNDPNCRVIIGQNRAIKYGNTLVGTKEDPCFNMFFYENDYSLDNRAQCQERNQGQGVDNELTIWDFFCTKRDKQIIRAVQAKEDVCSVLLQYDRTTGILPHQGE